MHFEKNCMTTSTSTDEIGNLYARYDTSQAEHTFCQTGIQNYHIYITLLIQQNQDEMNAQSNIQLCIRFPMN